MVLLEKTELEKAPWQNHIGDIHATEGEYRINGDAFTEPTPRKAVAKGVSIIHQYGDLALNLTVLENLFLGYELKKPSGLLDYEAMINKAGEVFSKFKIDIDIHAVTGDLAPVYQQVTAIAKALCKDARVLIVDEGGVSLDRDELECLFSVLLKLKDDGVCIIYISHLLDNVLRLSDRISALRNGVHISTVNAADVGIPELVDFIVGKSVEKKSNLNSHFSDDNRDLVLAFKDVKWIDSGYPLNFNLHKGEILGFTGPAGAGKSETFRALMGLLPVLDGGNRCKRADPEKILSPEINGYENCLCSRGPICRRYGGGLDHREKYIPPQSET